MSSSAVKSQGTTLHITDSPTSNKAITGITPGNPSVITVIDHGYETGNQIHFSDIAGTIGTDVTLGLNGTIQGITKLSDDTFSVLVDRSALTYTGDGNTYCIGETALDFVSAIQLGYPTSILVTDASVFANGDIITFSGGFTGVDAALLNSTSAIVTHFVNGSPDRFTINVDSSGKDIAVNFGDVTLRARTWTKVGQMTDIKGTSDTSPDIEVTDLDSGSKEYVQGLPDTGSITMSVFCVDGDNGLTAVEAAFDARTSKYFKITYPSGDTPVRVLNGYVKSFPKIGDASKDGVVTGSIEIKRSGSVTKA